MVDETLQLLHGALVLCRPGAMTAKSCASSHVRVEGRRHL